MTEQRAATQIFSGQSDESPAAAIAAALAHVVTHIENGATLRMSLVEVMEEGGHWRAVLRVAITPATRPDEKDHRRPAPEKSRDKAKAKANTKTKAKGGTAQVAGDQAAPALKKDDGLDATAAAALVVAMAEAEFEDAASPASATVPAPAGGEAAPDVHPE